MSNDVEQDVALVPTSLRRRLKLGCTVHPSTLDGLDALSVRLGTNRGRLIDRMTTVMAEAYKTGKVLCCDGQSCPVGRTNLPPVL